MNIIITADQIQQGDKIAVTLTENYQDRHATRTYTGVADRYEFDRWRTAEGWQLFAAQKDAVIELLDRPKSKIELPTGEGAAIEYLRINTTARRPIRRVATLSDGVWRAVGEVPHLGEGLHRTVPYKNTPEFMTDLLNNDYATSDFKVLFAGVAK